MKTKAISVKNFNIDFEKIFFFLAGLLIILMIIFPQDKYFIKIICMLGMLLCCKKKMIISKQLLLIWVVLVGGCIWGIFSGLINNSEEPLKYLTIHFIWPTLMLIFISQITNRNIYIGILKIIFFCNIILVSYDLLFAFGVIFGFYVPDINPTHEIPMFSYYGFTSRMNFINLNSITFTAPIVVLIWMTNFNICVPRIIINLAIVLTLLLLIISGRRSLMAEFIIMIPVSGLLYRFIDKPYRKSLSKNIKKLIFLVSFAIVMIYFVDTDQFHGYIKTFLDAFDAQEEPTKFAQREMLEQQFIDNPIMGVGVGKYLYEPFPGRQIFKNTFELMYHLWAAQTGIIGLTLYCLAFFSLLIYGVYIACKTHDIVFLFFLIGYLAILMAHATNPVINSFDFMISFFICLANLNTDLLYYKSN